jgi:tetratricopeptide (TPR) repeat protein
VSGRRARLAVAGGLLLAVAAAFEGTRRCGFVAFDDNIYVYRHPYVTQGLTWAGVRWAFGADLLYESPYADYWMPVTVLSRMLDVELFGLDPAWHHGVNVLLHGANAVLLFLLLESLTGARGRSAFAAGLFAVHPLTVESVAWVTERKDVLSGLFWMLAMLAYARYARSERRGWLAVAGVLMALGLMAKPTLVMLPLVLLALDHWPLGRLRGGRPRRARLLAEKIPLLALAAASAAVTVLAHARGGHLASTEAQPLASRILNALWSLAVYLRKVIWPADLAVLYPQDPAGVPLARALLAALALGLACLAAVRAARSRPYLLTGLAWSLLALFPVLGLIQTGRQALADRFMYVPLAGVGILVAWGLRDLAAVHRRVAPALPWAAAGTLLALVAVTRAQVRTWENTVTLFSRAIAVTERNHVAHHNLASALALAGDTAGAERHYREALRIDPGHAPARSALGVLLMDAGRLAEAREQQERALSLEPGSPDVRYNLALVLARMGEADAAAARYGEALRLDPSLGPAHYNWGNLLAEKGRWAEAEARYREAVRLMPRHLDARNNLALVLGQQGRWQEAADLLGAILAEQPATARARVNLGRALRALGRADDARRTWQEVVERHPGDPAAAEARDELARPAVSRPLDTLRAPR